MFFREVFLQIKPTRKPFGTKCTLIVCLDVVRFFVNFQVVFVAEAMAAEFAFFVFYVEVNYFDVPFATAVVGELAVTVLAGETVHQ